MTGADVERLLATLKRYERNARSCANACTFAPVAHMRERAHRLHGQEMAFEQAADIVRRWARRRGLL